MNKKLMVAAVCTTLLLSGCSKMSKRHGSDDRYGSDISYQSGIDEGTRFYGEDAVQPDSNELLTKRVFRFGFDRYDVSEEDYNVLAEHANYLSQHPEKHLRIEGHTDERGSREYNIGLGERRAKAVANVFLSKGISPNQFSVVSYGEEKPEAWGATEDAYRMNRRAVIVYEE